MDMLWYANTKDPVLEKKVVLLNGQKMITLGEGPSMPSYPLEKLNYIVIVMPVFLFSLVFFRLKCRCCLKVTISWNGMTHSCSTWPPSSAIQSTLQRCDAKWDKTWVVKDICSYILAKIQVMGKASIVNCVITLEGLAAYLASRVIWNCCAVGRRVPVLSNLQGNFSMWWLASSGLIWKRGHWDGQMLGKEQ